MGNQHKSAETGNSALRGNGPANPQSEAARANEKFLEQTRNCRPCADILMRVQPLRVTYAPQQSA